jgi:hypothetical protein
MCAYQVTLAVGNARRHDTGQRIRVDVVAPSKSDAAVIAERAAQPGISEFEYAYAKQIQPVLRPAAALAMAA